MDLFVSYLFLCGVQSVSSSHYFLSDNIKAVLADYVLHFSVALKSSGSKYWPYGLIKVGFPSHAVLLLAVQSVEGFSFVAIV